MKNTFKKNHLRRVVFGLFLTVYTVAFSQTAQHPVQSENNFTQYTTKDGYIIKVGDKVELGLPANGTHFNFIKQGAAPVVSDLAGNIVTIKKLKSYGKPETGYKMYAQFKGYGLIPVSIDIENALKLEEIIILDQQPN